MIKDEENMVFSENTERIKIRRTVCIKYRIKKS